MAFDKVVDSAVLESGLTSIANAIREKAGTSDALAFPAGFAEAIAAIESGGADLSQLGYTKASCGSITPDTNISSITHNLGVVPKLIMVSTDDASTVVNTTSKNTFFATIARTFKDSSGDSMTYYATLTKKGSSSSTSNLVHKVASGTFNAVSGTFRYGVSSANETTFLISMVDGGSVKYYMHTGVTYFWMCLG